jgi:hypothetical protein
MAIWLMVLIVLHVVPGVYWAGSTFALARDPLIGDLKLGKAQAGAAGLTVLIGIVLWGVNHAYPPGPQEWALGVGAICAIVAAGVQHGLAWPARRRLAQGTGNEAANRQRVTTGHRIAALLLVVTVAAMVIWRYM